MKITKATFYLIETGPQLRQVRYADRGFMDKVPPGLSGLFTNCEGFNPEEDLHIEFTADAPAPMYRLQLRLHTDGGLDAYGDWGSGYNISELEWEAKLVLARLMPMIVGVDAFDREYIWQRLWYAQRFFTRGDSPSTRSIACCGTWPPVTQDSRSTGCWAGHARASPPMHLSVGVRSRTSSKVP